MIATNAEVVKNQNEPNMSLMRRFTRRVQEAGVIRKARKLRYRERPASALKKKERALKRIAKQKKMERLRKLGKIK